MKKNIFSIIIITLSVLFSLISLLYLPEKIALHWGLNGKPDQYMIKYIGVFILPIVMIIINFAKVFSPKKDSYKEFQKSYTIVTDLIMAFLLLAHVSVLLFNLGYEINIEFNLSIGIGLLFIVLGNYLPKTKQNHFIGFRIPWTLNNEVVWHKTHRFGGKVLVITGLFIVGLTFSPLSILSSVLVTTLMMIIIVMIKSYLYHKQEMENKKTQGN